LGFGSSGRPEFICRNTEETKEYFIASVREWVRKTGFDKAGPYSIFGHSLGCWIASVYAERYPENIQQLLFISPASMAKPLQTFVRING
jgi:pimeloyl-ACP methyl ester carboxylesterase